MEIGCIYARKNTFANRYAIVKQNNLTPRGDRGRGRIGGGLVPHHPREEKKWYKSTIGGAKTTENRAINS